MDDCLQYHRVTVHKEGDQMIEIDTILPMISPSRVFSYSMFIEPIFLLRNHLAYDQLLELCFAATLQNNPYYFHHVMMKLAKKHIDETDAFQFSEHPFHDWIRESYATFGRWQSSLDKRFSPCGGNIPVTFGCHPDATIQEMKLGSDRLSNVIQTLFDYTEWIDDLGRRKVGKDPISEIPLATVKARQQQVLSGIDVKCQFNFFRLGVFTTLVTGVGLVQKGRHLRQLVVPTKGMASHFHLKNTNGDVRFQLESETDEGEPIISINEEDHDRAMLSIASGFGRPYFRDEVETLLVSKIPTYSQTPSTAFLSIRSPHIR